MPLDPDLVADPGSAEWWLLRLGKRLDDELPALNRLDAYDTGEHPLPRGHERCRETYRRFQRQARSNFVGLVTESVLDRLRVAGFRMGGQAEAGADEQAQLIWQQNQMDADAGLVMRDALVMRRAYVCVGPGAGDQEVLLTGEDPRQVIHAADPRNRRRLRAALKTWRDDLDGMDHAVVYLPETVHYYVAPKTEHGTRWEASHWDVEDDPVLNPLAPDVPVVPLVNRPEKRRMGFSEFEDVLDI